MILQSGRRDLNPGPPAPKAGALAGLRYAPIDGEVFQDTKLPQRRQGGFPSTNLASDPFSTYYVGDNFPRRCCKFRRRGYITTVPACHFGKYRPVCDIARAGNEVCSILNITYKISQLTKTTNGLQGGK